MPVRFKRETRAAAHISSGNQPAMPFSGFALAVLLLSIASHAKPCSDQEKSSLLRFIAELSWDAGLAMSWRNGTTSCCSWEGIACDRDGVVSEISLPGRGLHGLISPALGDLTGLRRLNLSHNSLSGELPWEQLLSSSSRLAAIDVSFNHLEGELLELPTSTTHGRPLLQVLNISSNLFTGEFPSATWKDMNNLIALNVSNNSFHGWMPSSFCITSPSFAMLDISYNRFGGRIPAGLGNCSALKVLKAGRNQLTGMLPDELFNATSLEYLSVPNNGLYGILDGTGIANLRSLSHLDLGGNRLNGKIPDSIGELRRLEVLHLDHNNMSGELPPAFSNCTNLITIDLRNNYFSGELTKVDFSTLINLKTLDLLFNSFTGAIPESIYSCSSLNALRLADNKLHGQLSPRIIPAWIKSLKLLFHLDISENNLTGEIPADLTEMPMLTTENTATDLDERVFLLLVYRGTSFEYRVTTAFPKMLNLGRNNFTGVIPKEIGAIPVELNNLNFLAEFNVSNNGLEGPIPAGGQFSTFTSSSFGGNPKLCGAIVDRPCASAETNLVSTLSTEWKDRWFAFVIGFGAFFGVGVLYDQIVLSKYFG
uniref:Leucine-rich repeat-containing N-terminal plant-type domain-containing protein n=1 Tax=Setaria viridis TaxID=4556 RepID=A0A4U6W6A4_SETVI|nr:hypothetical protein SEVIR_1G084400v2 [Setaria viridis]